MQIPKANFASWNLNDYVMEATRPIFSGKVDGPVAFVGHMTYPVIMTHPKHGPILQKCIGLVGQWLEIIDSEAIIVYFKETNQTIPMDTRWVTLLKAKYV